LNLILVFSYFFGIAVIDLPGMIKKKEWRDLILYALIFLLVFALAVTITLGVDVPSPIKAIQAFLRDVLHLSFKNS
jgi:hypothetical protein